MRHRERQAHGLAVAVVRILAEYDDLHLAQGAELECLENLSSRREDHFSGLFLSVQFLHEGCEIRFLKLGAERLLPALLYLYVHSSRA